jgi:hypothetical protein
LNRDITVEVEAKAKEPAVIRLVREIGKKHEKLLKTYKVTPKMNINCNPGSKQSGWNYYPSKAIY